MNDLQSIKVENGIYSIKWHQVEGIQTAIDRFGFKMPENILDESMSLSVCASCGAVYAGYQNTCRKLVDYHRLSDRYYDSRGYSFARDATNLLKECGGHPQWDLQIAFYEQTALFEFAYKLGSVTEASHVDFFKYKNLCLADVTKEALLIHLIDENQRLKVVLEQHHNALQEIANRMQRAGDSLAGF